mgnify:CR=1 FL=1|jgi:hypothetical protein
MLSAGEVAGDEEIVSRIGTGGMALVYPAHHRILSTARAVKILRPHLTESEEVRESIRAEGAHPGAHQAPQQRRGAWGHRRGWDVPAWC